MTKQQPPEWWQETAQHYWDGTLSPQEAHDFKEALEKDFQARQAFEKTQQTLDSLAKIDIIPPAGLSDRIMTTIQTLEKQQPKQSLFSANTLKLAASLLLIIGIAGVSFSKLEPTPNKINQPHSQSTMSDQELETALIEAYVSWEQLEESHRQFNEELG